MPPCPLTVDLVIRRTRLLATGEAEAGVGPDTPFDVMVADGRIVGVEPSSGAGRAPVPDPAAAADTVIDGSSWRIGPGLIDLQVNGGWGRDLTSNPEAVWEVGAELARHGVTAWLPTLVSAPVETRRQASAVLAAGPPPDWSGAEPLGWHFEGPHLNPARRGAHPVDALEPFPTDSAGDPGTDPRFGPLPRLMTLAPELEGGITAIRHLVDRGVVVSLGHTNADAATVIAAVGAGASMATHLFNAMSGIHHRKPGAVVGLLNSDAWLGLIADGHHVDPDVIRMVWALAADRVVLVSDAVAGLGLPDGPTVLRGRAVTVEEGTVRLPDGTLAGSVLPLDQAVVRLSQVVGAPLGVALTVASTNPARVLGDGERGRVNVGYRADLVAFDGDDRVAATFVAGRRMR